LGALAANVCFRSWRRRILFMAATIVLPILANGVRAFAVIYIDEVTGIEFAASDDHILFGWIFFGVAMALVMAVGWRFFDRKPGDPWLDATRCSRSRPPRPRSPWSQPLLLPWRRSRTPGPPRRLGRAQRVPSGYALPDVPGLAEGGGAQPLPWRPHYANADLFRIAATAIPPEKRSISQSRSTRGRKTDASWSALARAPSAPTPAGPGRGPARGPQGSRLDRIASHGTAREVATFYRVGDIVTGSDLSVKLETIEDAPPQRPARAVAVVVSAEAPAEAVSPRPSIDRFLAALGPPEALADKAAGLP
jgi:exosortase/archaeosortase family protein